VVRRGRLVFAHRVQQLATRIDQIMLSSAEVAAKAPFAPIAITGGVLLRRRCCALREIAKAQSPRDRRPHVAAPHPAGDLAGFDLAPDAAAFEEMADDPGSARASTAAAGSGCRSTGRTPPLTMMARVPVSMRSCTQPLVPSQSRMRRQCSAAR